MSTIVQQLRDDDITSVINCAAMRDINLCEKNPAGAVVANEVLPEIIGNTVRQLCVSTDYVFDSNEEDRPLNEDAVSRGALSVYGQTKLNGEKKVLERTCRPISSSAQHTCRMRQSIWSHWP